MATADQDLRVSAELLFSPEDPALREDPYPLYRRLRETDPVHRSSLGFWVVSGYADVASIQHDPRCDRGLRPDDNVYTFWGGPDSPISTEARRWMLLMNPPDHTRLRGLVRSAFRYRALTALRCRIQQLVDDLIDEVEEDGSMDVIADLAHPLPVTVIGDLLGLPIDDRRQCREWAEVIGRIFDPTPSQEALERAATAIHQASDYIREHVARRRRAPGDEALVAHRSGGAGRPAERRRARLERKPPADGRARDDAEPDRQRAARAAAQPCPACEAASRPEPRA